MIAAGGGDDDQTDESIHLESSDDQVGRMCGVCAVEIIQAGLREWLSDNPPHTCVCTAHAAC